MAEVGFRGTAQRSLMRHRGSLSCICLKDLQIMSEPILQARGRILYSSWFVEGLCRWLSAGECVRIERSRLVAKNDQHNRIW